MTLKKAVEHIPDLCGGASCSIFLLDNTQDVFVLRASDRLPQNLIGKASYRRGEGFTGWVGQTGRCLNVTSRDPKYLRKIDPALSWKGKHIEGTPVAQQNRPFLAAPIFAEGNTVGVIRIGDRKGNDPFGDVDEQMLATVASHISLAMAFRNRYEDRLKLLQTLQKLLVRLNESLSKLDVGIDDFRDSVLKQAAIAAAADLGVDVLTLYPFCPDIQDLETPPLVEGALRQPQFMKTPLHPDDVPWRIMELM